MSKTDYSKWPKNIQYHYDKTKEDIDKYGHSIKGVIGGKHDDRPFAYSIGASFTTGFEYISFSLQRIKAFLLFLR